MGTPRNRSSCWVPHAALHDERKCHAQGLVVVQLHLKLLMPMLASSADQSHVHWFLFTVGDGLTMEGNQGVRRSTRSHMRPLQYWRNESVFFGREHTCECWQHKNGCTANAALLSQP